MDIVGIPIKFALYKIGFFCKDRKRAVHILEAVFRRFQQCPAILVAPQLTAGREDPGVDQVSEDCIEIIFKFVPAFDCPADLIYTELRAKALKEKITDMKRTQFIS